MSRNILLHYHLFKNAGSSVDRILRESYGETWINYDKDSPGARISGQEMEQFILDHPDLKAISSHQIVPPIPKGDFNVFPIVFLRDPIDRIRSAWLFEWKKQLALDEPKGSLADYIIEKLKPRTGSVIANFHVTRLSNVSYDDTPINPKGHELDKLNHAINFLTNMKFFGIVERFDQSLDLMSTLTQESFPDLKYKIYRENTTQDASLSINEKYDQMKDDVGEELFNSVILRNKLDLQLYSYALGMFNTRLEAAGLQVAGTGQSDPTDADLAPLKQVASL